MHDRLQVKERISATLIAANLIIYSVDRNSIIDLFEGVVDAGNSISNALMNDRPCEKQNRIGSKLIDAWPDALLQHAVTSMLNDTSVCCPSLSVIRVVSDFIRSEIDSVTETCRV